MIHTEHLNAAWTLVQRGSRAAGVDGITLDLFSGVAPEQIQLLHRQLQREHYAASPAKGFYLPKKSGGQRLIGIGTVRDRIVQRYLLQAIYPALEASFAECCHAYRPGYSVYTAVRQVMERYRHQPTWTVKADIRQFFDHLAWPLLLTQLEQLQVEPVLMRLVEQQLKSGVVLQGHYCRLNQGVLQGGILSGALANLYLCEFDRRCLEAGIHLTRYGDDCVAVCGGWIEANRVLALIGDWLEDCFLTLNEEKTKILAPDQEFTFLGHQFCAGQVRSALPARRASPQPARASPDKKPAKPIRVSYGPPKACGIVKSTDRKPTTPPDTYWSDPMTTLYVTDQGAYLRVQHQQFQVFHQQELKCSVPINQVSHVVLFGCCNVSHGAVSLALRRRVPILYLASNGRYFGRLETEGQAQIEYLTQQVQRSLDPDFRFNQAQSIILGKLHNSRVVLQRLHRKRPTETAKTAIAGLADLMQKLPEAESIESMLGYEGQAAHLYFQAFATLLKGKFEFEKRTRRPPTDPVNSLLSLGYTLLSQNMHSMVEAAGLHTHFGNLHLPQKNRPSLVCDLVEEFRAFMVDSLVAYLINSDIFTIEDFTPPDERGGVYLYPDALKKFLKHWEEKLQQSVTHPHTGYKVSYRRCLELQVWEYVACLMGEREVYRPMKWER
ncbi:CRISPR-associated endonuclease Cas1 [Microcoleus sp. FACHB-1515]|uniref:CRISPR-associated endonuclease Cas1 n=1 Tax=Cyanophyceae TaxID=3028117 RepID=UPI001687EF6C|nr:CRISPR-associated endonuclease Cas1 [Microcoleus sp. FACHB-1515]MBD2090629.1 CRISPR-associated endonuclease Cas1 [Microcoleus sp. FACHB-1515]